MAKKPTYEELEKRIQDLEKEVLNKKETEKAYRESEEKYRNILESMEEGYVEHDLNGNHVFFNDAYCKIHGYSRKELEGTSYKEISDEKTSKELLQFYNRVYKTGRSGKLFDREFIKLNGEKVYLESSVSLIVDDSGEALGFRSVIRDITEKKNAELQLKESEEIFRTTVNAMNEGLILSDKNFKPIFSNPKMFELTGYEEKDLPDLDISKFFTKKSQIKISDDLPETILAGKSSTIELQAIKKDGEIVDLLVSGSPIMKDGEFEKAVSTYFDITELKENERALRESEEKFRDIANMIPVIIFQADIDGTFQFVNKTGFNTFGYNKKDIADGELNALQMFIPEDHQKVLIDYNKVLNKRGEEVGWAEYTAIQKEGKKFPVSIRATHIEDTNGKVTGIRGVVEDISEKKKTQEIMIQSEKMVSVGGLAAGMAHELNNPLGAILQATQNVLRRLSPDLKTNFEPAKKYGIDLHNLQSYMDEREINSFLKGIQQSGRKASMIISNMLQFSRKSESNMAPTDIAILLKNVIDLAGNDYDLKKKLDFRNIVIVKQFDANMPLVPCNETEIEQVIFNILNNAAWAMARQKRDIPSQITLRLRRENDWARIEIEDNGPGIDEEIRMRVFEPFFTTKPVGEGTGLGLSVSYMIITNNHKGTVEVNSVVGRGTNFIVKVPLVRPDN
jgi:PAS domain S-box-containing protein